MNKNNITKYMQVSIGAFSPFNPSSWTSIDSVVGKIGVAIDFFVGFSAVVAVGLLIVAGYNFITSAGDPDKVESAQKGVTAAIIGMLVVLLARAIVKLVLNIVVNNSVG